MDENRQALESERSEDMPMPDGQVSQLKKSHLQFPVVGLGASAGGLQALQRFFENLPSNNGMAFVVIMHLSPNHESSADKILQKYTRMPVQQVTGPTLIEANHVYLISPALQLQMSDGYLRVSELKPGQPRHIAIDVFLRTLADAHREFAVGVVLSGTGCDGSAGLARIKQQGGVTLVQAPLDAEYDAMPRSAIASEAVDFILPALELPQKLVELHDNAMRIHLPADPELDIPVQQIEAPEEARLAETALRNILLLVRSRTGHDFKHYKRATVLRRIERRMQVNRVADLPSYRELLQNSPDEASRLLEDLLIGVTNFFRDRKAFEALERKVIPRLFERPTEPDRTIRVWSAGYSSGEEAYSLAMLLAD